MNRKPSTRPAVTAACLVIAALGVPLAFAHVHALTRAYAQPPATTVVYVAAEAAAAPVEPAQPEETEAPARLEARWGRGWYAATPQADVCTGYVRIGFTGYGSEWHTVVRSGDLRAAGSNAQGHMPPDRGDEEAGSESAATAETHAALPADHRLRVGEALMGEWQGTWWPVRVVSLLHASGAGGARVQYDGYEHSSDEDMTRARLALRAPSAVEAPESAESVRAAAGRGVALTQGQTLAVGQRVLAQQGPTWRRAQVTGFACEDALVVVHFLGMDTAYDEALPRDRVRLEAPVPTAPGAWRCRLPAPRT